MSLIKNLKQFSTSTTGLMAIGIFSTLIISVSYRVFMKPEFERRRRQEAEAMADYIFQHEQQSKSSSSEHQSF
ncbi:hypothetical protein CVS40_9259 [Lucilia cuprina]|nr:hypothetical protein CVS40_9259 [Lucilia cuprina]